MKLKVFLFFFTFGFLMTCFFASFAGEKAYIANQNGGNVSVIDIDIAQVVNTIPVGFQPTSVAASEDGTRVFVLNRLDKTISVIDPVGDTVIKTLDIFFPTPNSKTIEEFLPHEIIAAPSGNMVYVSAASPSDGLLAVDVARGRLTDVYSPFVREALFADSNGNGDTNIDISPDGKFIYSEIASGIAKVDATTLKLIGIIELTVDAFVMTDAGDKLYSLTPFRSTVTDITSFLTRTLSSNILLFAGIDTVISDLLSPITISPDGQTLYFIIKEEETDLNNTTVIPPSIFNVVAFDLNSNRTSRKAQVGFMPSGLDITSDGKKLVVPNLGDNTVMIIDTESMEVISTVEVGATPRAYRRFISKAVESDPRPRPDETPTPGSTGEPQPTPTPITDASPASLNVEPATAGRSFRRQNATVTVLDRNNDPIRDVTVSATTNGARGTSVSPAEAKTDRNGVAEFKFTFRSSSEVGEITFFVDDLEATITQQISP